MPCKGKFCTRILTRDFSLGGFYSSTAIFLYAEMGKIRITEKETFNFDERFFSLDSLKPLKAIFLYAERALSCITEKETFDFDERFFR